MADRQDGAMLVQLSQWGSAMGLEEAMHAVWADDLLTAASDDDEGVTFGDHVKTSRVKARAELGSS